MVTQQEARKPALELEATGARDSTLRDVLYVLFRNKYKIAAVFVLVVAASIVYSLTAPEVFQAEAELFIKIGGRQSSMTDAAVSTTQGPVIPPSRSAEEEINSGIAILEGPTLAGLVIDDIGAEWFLSGIKPGSEEGGGGAQAGLLARAVGAGKGALLGVKRMLGGGGRPVTLRDQAIQVFRSNLAVIPRKKSTNIYMTLDAPDPVVAQKALERALAHFQDLYIKIHVSDATPELFLRRKEAAEVALKTAEGNLQQFMSANFITSMEHQKNLLLERRDQLKKDLTDARSAVLGSTAKVAVIEQSLSREPERIMQSQGTRANPVVEEFKKKLAELKTQEQGLAIKFKDDVPQLKDVRAQIKELEAALRAEPASTNETIHAPNPAHQALRASLATERAILSEQQERQKEFEDELLKAEAELARLTALEPQLAQLQREVEVAKASFNNEVASYQRAQSSADLDREKVSNVSVVTAATLPVEPIKPRKKLNLVLGVMLGLFGGVAFAFVMEYLDQSIKTTEDVEKHLGLPVLATVTEKEFKKCI